MRIAFIGGRGISGKYSGIETYYEEVGQCLAERGHDVSVYCRPYFTPAMDRYKGMNIVRVWTWRSKHFDTFVHSLLSSFHCAIGGYDVVHYHALGPSLFAFIPRLFGQKTVVTVQGLDWKRQKWGWFATWFLRACERASIAFPNSTIVVSKVLQRYYRERYDALVDYIPNGVTMPAHRPPAAIRDWGLEPGKYILFLGRLSEEKNCHLLVDAYERLDTDVKLVFAGGSTHADAYFQRLKAHESDRIRFLGYVQGEPLQELLSNPALFVLPSGIEGLSIALLEAMSHANCVLTSDIPENLELVKGAGYAFRDGDAGDLARMLRLLLDDETLRRDAGAKARDRVNQQYLWSYVAERTEQVYLECLAPSPVVLPRRKETEKR